MCGFGGARRADPAHRYLRSGASDCGGGGRRNLYCAIPGRMNDVGRDGISEVVAMHEVLVATGSNTKVLLASIRRVSDMVALARHGVDCFTMAPAVAEHFFTDPTTAEAARTFEEAVRETST